MKVYKRILVAVDFSDINRLAIARASLLAQHDDCDLIMLHVIEHFPLDDGPLSSVFKYNAAPIDELAKHVSAKLDGLKRTLDHSNVQTEFRITSKSARYEILRFANKHAIDLIVVAPHGQGVIGTLGSTATGILNNANCDVLAVREDDG